MSTTTFSRLRDGTWGVRVSTDKAPEPGARYLATRKDGREVPVTIKSVLWTDDRGSYLCSITEPNSQPPRSGRDYPAAGPYR